MENKLQHIAEQALAKHRELSRIKKTLLEPIEAELKALKKKLLRDMTDAELLKIDTEIGVVLVSSRKGNEYIDEDEIARVLDLDLEPFRKRKEGSVFITLKSTK